jgi:regulator of ribonuclease activity A
MAAIRDMPLGVMALSAHPQKTDKKNIGEADVPVSFGGISFRPGEWLYADGDGILVATAPLQ